MNKIRKAVFPVAGMGTRFLPATKAIPKEMLPIVDKPLIQYAVEEAVSAGITELIFVTHPTKRSIEQHFQRNSRLERALDKSGKDTLLAEVQDILPEEVTCHYVQQPEPLGLGHAVLCARDFVGQEPFAVLLADDLIRGERFSCLQQMIERFESDSMIAVEKIDYQDSIHYGVVAVSDTFITYGAIQGIVEKPAPEQAPSSFGVVGRYLLVPEIFSLLENTAPDRRGEIQLTDALQQLQVEQSIQALAFSGKRYDCGNKLGYLQATVQFGLDHPELGEQFKHYLLSHQVTQ